MPDNLNTSIRRWRDALACRESIKTEQLDELQDHLEAELQCIPVEGLIDEERVAIAARRVGAPDDLERQFFAANPGRCWSRRLMWMVTGYLAIAVVDFFLITTVRDAGLLALQVMEVSLPWRIAATSLLISATIALVLGVAIPLATDRSRQSRSVPVPSRWLMLMRHKSKLMIGIALFVLPCLMGGITAIRNVILVQRLDLWDFQEYALAANVMQIFVPLAAPLTLFILASALGRQSRTV